MEQGKQILEWNNFQGAHSIDTVKNDCPYLWHVRSTVYNGTRSPEATGCWRKSQKSSIVKLKSGAFKTAWTEPNSTVHTLRFLLEGNFHDMCFPKAGTRTNANHGLLSNGWYKTRD